jgi:hypothetical protein
VAAVYSGDALSKPSTGSLTQQVVAPRGCNSSFSCSHTVAAANGTAQLEVGTYGDGNDVLYTIAISFEARPMSCTTANTGDTAVFDVSYSLSKYVVLDTYEAAATTANQNPDKVCWGSDQVFQTAAGTPATFNAADGLYEGLLPMCVVVDGTQPCVDGPSEFRPAAADPNNCDCDPRARLETVIQAPPGDPRVTR